MCHLTNDIKTSDSNGMRVFSRPDQTHQMRKETTMTAPRMPSQTSHLSTDMNLKMDCSGSFFRSKIEIPDWSKYGATKSIT